MNTSFSRVSVRLILIGALSCGSHLRAAEIREIACEADMVFPERECVVPFQDGVPHGTCRAYDRERRLILTEEYVNGRVQGKRVCYYPSGKKFSEMNFVDGLAEGETTTWYENGTVASRDHMQHGLPHGMQTLYFPNGNKSVESPHDKGVTHGTCRHYLPDGRLFGLSTFADGVEVRKQVIIEPTSREYQEILDAGKFSAFLKDHWPSDNKGRNAKPLAGGTKEIRQGDQVEVEWNEKWYPATVVRIEKRGYYIHYQGYDDSWNEYVRENRIRTLSK